MKKRKWLSGLLAAAIMLTVIPTTVFAGSAEITDEVGLKEAIAAVADNQQTTIPLGNNIKLSDTLVIEANKNIILDLNGNTLSISQDKDVLGNYGTLVVKNGTIAAMNRGSQTQGMAITNFAAATLTVEQDTDSATKLIGRMGIQNYGVATVMNGTIESYNRNAIWGAKDSELTIYDGTVTSPTGSSGYGRAISSEGNVTIYGGTFYSGGSSGAGDNYMNAIGMFNGAILLVEPRNGKTVTVTSETDYAVSSMGNAKIIINGGEFACKGSRTDIMDFESGNVQISGGSFQHEPYDEYLADHHIVLMENGKYVVKETQLAQDATVNSFAELEELMKSSILEPKNITLGADIEIPESADLSLPKGFTLTIPENYTLRVGGLLRLDGILENNGVLTVGKNGFIENPLNVSGNGTITDYPVVKDGVCNISTPMQLQWLSRMVELDNNNIPSVINLTNDISLPDIYFTPIGNQNFYYNSTFDGNNYAIHNIKIMVTSQYHGGLFGNVGDVTIKNLTIDGISTNSTSSYIGALIGYARGSCSIKNVHVENYTVESPIGYGVGGFIGQIWSNDPNDRVDFIDCTLDANISGYANVGGFWGTSTGSKGTIGIYNSELKGTVNALNVNGGICGGYGATAPVQIIGLDNTQLTATVKGTTTTKLVSYTSAVNDMVFADAAQYQAVKDANGKWKSVGADEEIAAVIDSVPYVSLEDAIADADENDTIRLMNDVYLKSKLNIKKESFWI